MAQPIAHSTEPSDNLPSKTAGMNAAREEVSHEQRAKGPSSSTSSGSNASEKPDNGNGRIDLDEVPFTGSWHQNDKELVSGDGPEFKLPVAFTPTVILKPSEIHVAVNSDNKRSFTICDPDFSDKYSHLQYIAHGSFGVVCKATDKFGREVAIKFLMTQESGLVDRFNNEVCIMARLGSAEPSDRIVNVHDSGNVMIEDSTSKKIELSYASMEFISNVLSNQLSSLHKDREAGDRGRFTRLLEGILRTHFRETCLGMQYAHSQGILHRDLKPANIATSTAELGERTRIIDWGLGHRIYKTEEVSDRAHSSSLVVMGTFDDLKTLNTAAGTIVGSAPYMSPEQACGLVLGPQSDVYALGAVLYEIATGQYPYKGTK